MGRPHHRPSRACVALLLAGAMTACDSLQAPDPEPGALRGELVSPEGNEAGLVAELVGPEIRNIEMVTGPVFTHAEGDTTRVVLIRNVPGVVQFRVEVPNVHDPPGVHLLEVTDAGNRPISSFSDFRIEFAPVDRNR